MERISDPLMPVTMISSSALPDSSATAPSHRTVTAPHATADTSSRFLNPDLTDFMDLSTLIF
jgi:hypothetical protein